MIRFLSLCFLALLVAQMGCDSDVLQEEGYIYTAFNEEDEAIVTGSFHLEFRPSSQGELFTDISGTWDFDVAGDDESPCHKIGTGQLGGSMNAVNRDNVFLNLNPGVVDDNLFLNGRFEGNTLVGEWSVSTFAGVVCSGRFEAVAQ